MNYIPWGLGRPRFAPASQPSLLDVVRIREGVKALDKHPEMGRPVEELPPEFREWVIEFGQGAYVALYHYDGRQVVILTVRHGGDAGY